MSDPTLRPAGKKFLPPTPNTRSKTLIFLLLAALYVLAVLVFGLCMDESRYGVAYADKFLAPGLEHPFGTDFLGRDMFYRSIKGLSASLVIGLLAAGVSSVLALALGIAAAAKGGKLDQLINFAVDCCMGLPHLLLLLLISFMLGRGVKGVAVAVALTHWPELTRVVRAEVLQIRSAQYVQAAYKMGKSKLWVAKAHLLPQVLPVYLVGLVLLFPHAIMHEAALTFLGFGLPAESPAIGAILAEAMAHIATGKWWLALFPGLMLLALVILFDLIAEYLKKLLNPGSGNV